MSILQLLSKAVAYKDLTGPTNQPQQRHYDWTRQQTVEVSSPKSNEEQIPAGGTFTFFSGQVSTGIDGTTALSITRSPLDSTRYRFSWAAGTPPAFRVNRGLALTGLTVTVAVQDDATALMTLSASNWGSLAVGDELFIPGTTTGDTAGPFSSLNEGIWTVIGVLSATVIQVARASDATFEGTSEAVAITLNAQVIGMAPTGVLPGDSVDISAGFSSSVQKTFVVERSTPDFIEVISTVGLPLETLKIPGAAGFVFFTAAKRVVLMETDQEVAIRINGMTDDRLRFNPLDVADADAPGQFQITGPVWSLTVKNRSSVPATVSILSAE